ncbi:MAG TPA: NBR1-Ig-like domain-containing protein [Casimicrobiaceae bacterium]|nr:NBR1-Ig-like domain-containing protein [Casimicrobiaceae bacterium]
MRALVAFGMLLLFGATAHAQHIVRVLPKGLTYDAAFVSQSVPASLQVGVPAQVSITMRNTGTATWIQKEGDVFLATQEPQDNYYWCILGNQYGSHSGNRVWLPGDVAPGEAVTFVFYVQPLSCGFAATPPFRFRMLSQIYGTFGEETPDPGTAVTTAAEFVSQQVPAATPSGASIAASVTFRNTTNTTWAPGAGYALVSTGPLNNTIWGVQSVALAASVAPGATVTFPMQLTTPSTAGTYNFQWQMTLNGAPFGQTSPATAVSVVDVTAANYEGLWWASPAGSESGWGLNLAHQGDTIFATWFTYDATGKAWWLSMTAELQIDGSYAGTLNQNTGPPFSAVPFNPLLVHAVGVGVGTLTFDDANNGTFEYTVNGVTQTKAITRQAFGPLPTCTFDLVTDLTQAYNYQDIWWAAPAGVEAGWGINLTHQGDVIFATWFTYDSSGNPTWVSVTAPRTGAATYSGKLYRTTGPPFDATPFDPSLVQAQDVGTATFTFTDGNDATFDYTLDGITQSKAITRQVFVSPGTVCQ